MPDCGEPFTGTDLSNLDNAKCRRIAGAFFVLWMIAFFVAVIP